MRHIPDSRHVCQRFTRSALTYSEHAIVQKRMAERLCALIRETTSQKQWQCALDLGCGTGFLTDAFLRNFSCRALWAYDVVEAFSACYAGRETCHFVPADLNTQTCYPVADVILSGATLQWIASLPALFARLHRASAEKALFAFSSFTPENFVEIATISERGLVYPTLAELRQWLETAGWRVLHAEHARFVVHFQSPRDILRHLKNTGVTATGITRGWTKAELQRFEEKYALFFDPDKQGYSLTYTPLYVVAERFSVEEASSSSSACGCGLRK